MNSFSIVQKKPKVSERSPLFTLMNNLKSKYVELETEDELESGKTAAGSDEDSKTNRSGIVAIYTLMLVFFVSIAVVIMVYTSGPIDHGRMVVSNEQPPVTSQATKMTLIHVNTIGNEKIVKVVKGNGLDGSQVLADGRYVMNVENNGWNHLRVHIPDIPLSDDYSYFSNYFMSWEAMGFLEGFVTCNEIQNYYANLYAGLFDGGDIQPEAVEFLVANHEWLRQQAEQNWKSSEYWLTVKATLIQMTGVLNGMRAGCPTAAGGALGFDVYSSNTIRTMTNKPTLVNFLILNANGDLYQVAAKYNQQNAPAAADDDYHFVNPPPPSNASTLFDDDNHDKTAASTGSALPDSARPDGVLNKRTGHLDMKPKKKMPRDMKIEEFSNKGHYGSDHCSALIRLLPDNSDILFAHNTWDDFQNAAPRIFKQYSFPQPVYRKVQGIDAGSSKNINSAATGSVAVAEESVESASQDERFLMNENKGGKGSSQQEGVYDASAALNDDAKAPTSSQLTYSVGGSNMVQVHFSSSPGLLTSVDDFYTLSGNSHMAVIETSLDIYDTTLLTQIHYDSVLSWVRVRVANHLATNGDHWSRLFSLYHSGTYVNQWMVVDFNVFVPGTLPTAASGLLTVLEEMPGYIYWEDMSDILASQGYWASFNDAYFEVVREMSGADLMCSFNTNFCYEFDPRNLIFQERAPKVLDMEGMKLLMQYNNFRVDPLSKNDSCNAIACRFDLQPVVANQYPFGALDAKISSVLLASPLHAPGGIHAPTTPSSPITGSNSKPSAGAGAGTGAGAGGSFLPTIWSRMGPSHDDQPVFCWSAFDSRRDVRNKKFIHLGAPECFDFDWIVLPPKSAAASGK